ncbi:MAG: replication initiation protein [Janthinobacterium lividum]
MQAPSPKPSFVVQHNALINSRFDMTLLEMRVLLAMLKRINRQDSQFTDCYIPVSELAPPGSEHVPYADVAALVKNFARRAIDIEVLGPEGRRIREAEICSLPLLYSIRYQKAHGTVVARFNDAVRPYLLQLRGNFTSAELKQFLKLRSVYAHRIYWLLKEYANFGCRQIEVAALRNLLGLTTEYEGRFDHFTARVLKPVQRELSETDLPFTYGFIKPGRAVTEIWFEFPKARAPWLQAPPTEAWARALCEVGVAVTSLDAIRAKLNADVYDEGYITYVLEHVRIQVKKGKIKRASGAVFKALTNCYLLSDYQQAQQGLVASLNKTSGVVSRKPATSTASTPQFVRYRLQEAQDAFETMVRKKMAKGATFEENLQLVYLSQGFRQERDSQGVEWLVKPIEG